MMYFTPLKTAVILGLCLLGAILCIPNLFPAPAPWMPWRQVHLGLDLRGGSYLLLEVDMKAVVKERLESTVDAVRQALRPGAIFYQTLEAQPDQNRVLLKLRDATKLDAALAAIRPLVAPDSTTGTPEFDVASTPDGTIVLALSPVAMKARCSNRSRSCAGASTRPASSIRRSSSRATIASSCSCRASATRTGSRSCWARPPT
jgi:preprotein translocase subunit SecD